jgi:channel protein (hemolysin III family)
MSSEIGPVPELYHLPGFHEPFSAISHLVGAVIFVVLGGLLLWRGRGNTGRVAVLGIYAGSCVFLLSMSAVYHMMVRGGTAHRVFERLDHSAIFVLIAGTFTPAHALLFRGWLRWVPLLLVWTAAITGITLKSIFLDDLAEEVGLTCYLTLGWLGAVSAFLLGRRFGWGFVKPLLWGGGAYSVAAALEFNGWPVLIPGVVHAHEVFHMAVLVGAFGHWSFVWQFAEEPLRRGRRMARLRATD